MTNYPIDGALAATEGAFEIDLLNKVTGTTYPQAAVYGTNTLGQVLQEYAVDIGVNSNDSKILFENKRTGASTSDTNETVEGLGLQEGDVLAISDNAGVAAEEEVFEIEILNITTGEVFSQVPVYGSNTLGQVYTEYSPIIGLDPEHRKNCFVNKKTGVSTINSESTVKDLGLQNGDMLEIYGLCECCP